MTKGETRKGGKREKGGGIVTNTHTTTWSQGNGGKHINLRESEITISIVNLVFQTNTNCIQFLNTANIAKRETYINEPANITL